MTTSQQQAIREILPILSILLVAGWFPKKLRAAAKIAIGALQVIADSDADVPVLVSPDKAALSAQVAKAQTAIGTSFITSQTT